MIPMECPLDTDLTSCDVQQVGSLTFHVIVAQEINGSCSLTPLCVHQLATPTNTDLGMVKLLNSSHYTPFANLQHGGQYIVVMRWSLQIKLFVWQCWQASACHTGMHRHFISVFCPAMSSVDCHATILFLLIT